MTVDVFFMNIQTHRFWIWMLQNNRRDIPEDFSVLTTISANSKLAKYNTSNTVTVENRSRSMSIYALMYILITYRLHQTWLDDFKCRSHKCDQWHAFAF